MSDGVAALQQQFTGNAALLALVPEERIGAGVFPQGTALPYVSLSLVSSVDRNLPSPGVKRRVQDRVQATVAASDYEQLREVMKAVKDAAADSAPAVDGISEVTIHSLGAGPDFMDEAATIYLGSRDFRVWYNEPA